MENVCRTCLRVQAKMSPLLNDPTLLYKIETIASIHIEVGDSPSYPSTICQECIANVNKLFNFRKVIISSEKELKDRQLTLDRQKAKTAASKDSDAPSPIKIEHSPTIDASFDPNSDSDTAVTPAPQPAIKESIKRALAIMKLSRCSICEKTFTSRIKLYNHRRTKHIAPGVCNICGMVVRSDNLRRHVLLHSEGPAECEHCGKVFKNSESLRGHKLIHRGVIFTCEICGKHSKVKAEHGRHMKTHLDPEVGKMTCEICGKKVRDLKKHMHSHTGERPYMCRYCNKGFTSPYSLKVHTRQHTNEKPYSCNYCPMAFPQKVSLVTHLKSKHNCVL